MKRLLALLLAVFFLAVGCTKPAEPAKTAEPKVAEETQKNEEKQEEKQDEDETTYPLSWKENFDGSEVEFKIDHAPERAISMSQATTEMMLAVGLKDQMVGTAFLEEEIYESLKDDYEKVKVLSEKWPSLEVFMAENPDFASGWPVPFTKRAIEAKNLIEKNVNIFIPESMKRTDANLETNFEDLLMYGKIFNHNKEAKAFVDAQREKLTKVQEGLKDLPEKRVFIYDSEDGDPFTVYEGYTTNVLKLIGAKNILADKGIDKTWDKASWEEIVKEDPEYIIVVDYGVSIRNTDDFDQKVQKMKDNPVTKDITAVKNNNFIRVKLSEITPGVRTVDALERLAKTIHAK